MNDELWERFKRLIKQYGEGTITRAFFKEEWNKLYKIYTEGERNNG